jgi:hypothetical protein
VQESKEKKDLNSPGGEELMKAVGGPQGLPFLAFLDCHGDVIVNSMEPGKDGKKPANIGHPNQPHEVDWFMVMLSKGAPNMATEERATLEYCLRHQ